MPTPTAFRELYDVVHDYTGPALFSDVLSPWFDKHADATRELLVPLAVCGEWQRNRNAVGAPIAPA